MRRRRRRIGRRHDRAAAGSDTTTGGGTPVEGGTVRVWIMGDSGPDFEQLVAPFAERTGIDVEVESIPWENVNDKLTTAVASGDGPDVVQIGLSNLAAFQAADDARRPRRRTSPTTRR